MIGSDQVLTDKIDIFITTHKTEDELKKLRNRKPAGEDESSNEF